MSPQLAEDSFESFEAPSDSRSPLAEAEGQATSQGADYSWESTEKEETEESGKVDDSLESEEKKEEKEGDGTGDDNDHGDPPRDKASDSFESEEKKENTEGKGKDDPEDEYEADYEDDDFDADDSLASPSRATGAGASPETKKEPSGLFGDFEDESATFESSGAQ